MVAWTRVTTHTDLPVVGRSAAGEDGHAQRQQQARPALREDFLVAAGEYLRERHPNLLHDAALR